MAIASIAPGDKFVLLRSQIINWSVLSAQRLLLEVSKADWSDADGDEAGDGGDDMKADSDHSDDEETPTTPKRRRARSKQVESPLPPPSPSCSRPMPCSIRSPSQRSILTIFSFV